VAQFTTFRGHGRGPRDKVRLVQTIASSLVGESCIDLGPRMLTSHGVDGDVDLEAGGGVPQEGADVILEKVSDAVKLHHVARFLA
jgi:hypothetical protein